MDSVFRPNQILKISGSDLLRDLDLTGDELLYLLDLADEVKRSPREYAHSLDGKSIGLLFEKPSLRTQLTFELAISQLGGDSVFIERKAEANPQAHAYQITWRAHRGERLFEHATAV